MPKDLCRNCAHFRDDRHQPNPRPIYERRTYYCAAPIPDLSKILPEAVVESFGFQQPRGLFATRPNAGEFCPTYTMPKQPELARALKSILEDSDASS